MNLGSIKDKTNKTILKKRSAKKAVSLLAVCCVAVIGVTAAVSLNKQEETPVLDLPKISSSPDVPHSTANTKATIPPYSTVPPTESDAPASSGATVSSTMLLPVSTGNVLKGYASDSLVYSNTLNHWSTHTALDISAPEGTLVLSAKDGTVSTISEDELMGLTVTISHTDGLETIYSSLESVPDEIKEGVSVLQGQAIGAVGNSASSESSDGAHLHFEVKKDGKNVNPQNYLSGFGK